MDELKWIKLSWIRNSEIAKRLGISVGLFSQKLNLVNGNRFKHDEIEKLNNIKREFILELL